MGEAQIIDGRAAAADIQERVTRHVRDLHDERHVVPGLAVVLVGEDPASQVYVRMKEKRAAEVGIRSFEHVLPESVTEKELVTLVEGLNDDPAVHGILVQLPLPGGIDATRVLEAIAPAKDVDGFHPVNVGRLVTEAGDTLVPCTPQGCMLLLDRVHADMTGLHAVVVGRSNIVGKPVAQLLLQRNCTVETVHSRTRDPAAECARADILVAAAGKREMVRGDWIKPGATVLDVGINRIEPGAPGNDRTDGKARLMGDVCFDEARHVAGAITPVPGGVGPMTIASLMRNTVIACCRQHGVPVPPDL